MEGGDDMEAINPASLFAAILAICAEISCIGAAIAWIVKGVQTARTPSKKIEERLAAVERAIEEHKNFFASDKRRLETIEEGNRVTQKAILALLSHGIDGNDVEAMRVAKSELQEYLIGKN